MPPPTPIRLAILEADVPLGATRAKYGSYGAVFASLFHKACDASNVPRERLQISGWDVVGFDGRGEGEGNREGQGEGGKEGEGWEDMGGEWGWRRRRGLPRKEEVDAVLVSGSRFNAFDDDAWILRLVGFIREVLQQRRVKIVGVCFGHQIVGRALGAKVGRSKEWEVSVCEVSQTERGKEVFGGGEVLSIFQMHRDIVFEYPAGAEKLGSSGGCQVQGMFIPARVMTVQGHPEFTEEIVAELLESRHAQGIFGDEVYEEARGRVGRPHDGVVVARGVLRFLMGG